MALKNSITLENGINVVDAYVKIDFLIFTSIAINAVVSWYATQEARDSGLPKILSQNFELPYQSSISLTEAYGLLKTLSNFSNAVDC